jgi:methyltransferase (TIGR00027 family)
MTDIEVRYLGRVWRISGPPIPRPQAPIRAINPREAEYRGSITALSTALMRAAHTRLDPEPLINDEWGDRLVPEWARDAFRDSAVAAADPQLRSSAPGAILDATWLANRAYPHVITRTRYSEEALRECVATGMRQHVIIGAGFDGFALGRPLFAEDVNVFEIDHPATQALKRQRIEECGIAIPASLHLVPADLAEIDLATVLASTAYRSDICTFFSCLGVTEYLTRQINLAMFRAIATCSPIGSEIVFTYLDAKMFSSESEGLHELQEYLLKIGEPYRCGFAPDRLVEDLRGVGFEVLEDLDDKNLLARYSWSQRQRMAPLDNFHIVRARVANIQ